MSAPPFCMAPFGALSIGANGDVRPCCQFIGSIGSLSDARLDEIWSGSALEDLRQSLRRGDTPEACWKCTSAEAAGGRSLRQELNRRFADHTEDSATQRPVYMDFRYSNLCNFRCRSCHHGASSRWYADAKAMGTTNANTALLTAFHSAEDGIAQFKSLDDAIRELYFAGGEPLMEKQNADLLGFLIDQGRTDIILSYNTNLSVLDVEAVDLTTLWQHFPKLYIEASIDAIGEAGSLIRRGFDWDVFRANMVRLRETCPHARIRAGITVSALNLLRLPELCLALHDECGFAFDFLNIHALQMPLHYDIAILPDAAKERAAMQLEALAREIEAQEPNAKTPATLRQLIKRMEPVSIGLDAAQLAAARAKFRQITSQLDGLRRESTVEILPELAPLMIG